MRLLCWFCGKSVSTELPNETVIRAVAFCPECIEAKRVHFPEDEETDAEPD
jgi:hypothetical protein